MKNNESKYIEDENGRFYTERIVLAEEVDFNSKWTLKSILSWMQGMAEKHSDFMAMVLMICAPRMPAGFVCAII
ncbi:MAG: hypothetical protein WCR98_04230 [Saccharofermentanales bacterium]